MNDATGELWPALERNKYPIAEVLRRVVRIGHINPVTIYSRTIQKTFLGVKDARWTDLCAKSTQTT